MNFGILLVQGLVNSFGFAASVAFAAVVKIDAFAYMPVQDFGNAFSTFIAQNHGAQSRSASTGASAPPVGCPSAFACAPPLWSACPPVPSCCCLSAERRGRLSASA